MTTEVTSGLGGYGVLEGLAWMLRGADVPLIELATTVRPLPLLEEDRGEGSRGEAKGVEGEASLEARRRGSWKKKSTQSI